MIKFENTEIYGWNAAIHGMRNPMNSWDKSDTSFCSVDAVGDCKNPKGFLLCNDCIPEYVTIGEKDLKLMKNLVRAGTDHSKFMRMITVTVDITAPLYWWKEFDTYKVGTVRNSCSTMHKIHSKEFTLDDFSCEHLSQYEDDMWLEVTDASQESKLIEVLTLTLYALNRARDLYIETKEKKYWWQMIQLLPSSYNQRATVQLNYQVLRSIYHSDRKHHKLDEWREGFMDWIRSLPYSELITEPSVIVSEWIKIEPDEEGMYTGNLPDEGEEVLFCAKNGEIFIDELCCDGFDDDGNRMAYIGNGYDLDDIAAWMPLPKPYKE